MASFFAELKRRHVYRVAAAYAVVAWVLIQLVNNLSPMLRLPDWAGTLVLLLLLAGFPVALIFAWTLEMKAPAGGAGEPAPAAGRIDLVLAGALAVVIALILYQELSPLGAERAAQPAPATAPAAGISIAVLPLVNLSGDPGQEFFSDGMTEEITAALTKVPGLRVLGRTSAFEFKGQNRDLRTIGQALGATHLIEGSVRKAGNRVRITAQLVKADDDTHLWAENYDRDLTDIFAIQEDIARAIAAALRTPLGLQQGQTLVRNRTSEEGTYENYLRAKGLVRGRSGSGGLQQLTNAIALLEQVVAQDPNYAPAWALLSSAHAVIPVYHPAVGDGAVEEARTVVSMNLAKAEEAARRAIQLDPQSPDAQVAMGLVEYSRAKSLAASEYYLRALALDPENPDALHFYSGLLADLGYLSQSLMIRKQLQELEPYVPVFNGVTARVLWVTGQADAVEALLPRLSNVTAALMRARIFAAQGRFRDAADSLALSQGGIASARNVELAAQILRAAPARPRQFPKLGYLGFVYLDVGAPEHALDNFEDNVGFGFTGGAGIMQLWERAYESVRKTGRFKTFVRDAGLYEFWRAKGFPDLCRPLGFDDFVCD